MSPYDPDSRFSMSALCRLENKGIQVLTSLGILQRQLMVAAKITFIAKAGSEYKKLRSNESKDAVEVIIRQWILGDNSALPPTWRSLHQVLRELGLEELSQEIEEFLSSESGVDYRFINFLV